MTHSSQKWEFETPWSTYRQHTIPYELQGMVAKTTRLAPAWTAFEAVEQSLSQTVKASRLGPWLLPSYIVAGSRVHQHGFGESLMSFFIQSLKIYLRAACTVNVIQCLFTSMIACRHANQNWTRNSKSITPTSADDIWKYCIESN